MELLLAIKKVIELDDSDRYYIWTCNRNTNCEGYASFHTNGEKKIKVYEGASNGSDDHSMTYEEFLNNYEFVLRGE